MELSITIADQLVAHLDVGEILEADAALEAGANFPHIFLLMAQGGQITFI